MEPEMQALAQAYSPRVLIKTILGRADSGVGLAGSRVRIGGWVKTGRLQEKNSIAFLELNDGSCPANLQVLVDHTVTPLAHLIHTGTCLHLEGILKEPPKASEQQKIELKADTILHIGTVDASKYPIAKTRLNLDYLRTVQHLRARTNTISAVARIRNALATATHTFFQKHNFLYVHTPIVTTSDCEGAGEMFQVTTLLSDTEKREKQLRETPLPSEDDLLAAKAAVSQRGSEVKELKGKKDATKAEIEAALQRLKEAKADVTRLQERMDLKGGLPQKQGGGTDYSSDFFGRQAYLTVSGQLQVETYACGLSSVYTFGPTFRAENSHTTRHLAEFWMIEPEIAFADIEDDMNCAEDYIRFLCQWLLDNCEDDMKFFSTKVDKTALERVQQVASTPFARITYTEAIALLEQTGKTFENPVSWGIDMASEHERYLAEDHFKKPVIVYNYPKDIKAFYMRLNDDGKTVAAMDVLVPKVGELVGGSQREERYDVLVERLREMNLPLEPYDWYLDLRRYGTVKHAGFGLGFERMVLFATGIENIRDVIPFPRYPGKAEF